MLERELKITICDTNPAVARSFEKFATEVSIVCGRITDLVCDAYVSPANSFGFMDGGVDWAYTQRFGPVLQQRLQAMLERKPFGEILVGEAWAISTDDVNVPWVISAPTMRVPKRIADPADVMLAARAAVDCARRFNLNHIAFPGMGTGCGALDPSIAAQAVMTGIRAALNPPPAPTSWQEAQARHFGLTG